MRNRFETLHTVLNFLGSLLLVPSLFLLLPLVVEKNTEVCESLYAETGVLTINGNAAALASGRSNRRACYSS